MSWPEPALFVWGLGGITTLGALLPLDFGQRRHDEHIVLTITATAELAILGPRGLLLVWGAVAVGLAIAAASSLLRGGSRRATRSAVGWLLATATAVSVGFSLGYLVYVGLFGRDFPVRLSGSRDCAIAALVLVVAWLGTMSVRVASHQLVSGPVTSEGLDPFDSLLVPYLLPVVGGGPLVAATVALYRQDDPWPALTMLGWCLPLYAVCRFELHRRRIAQQLRREAATRQRLAALGHVTARVLHQTRHQAGLMGWSIHRLRRLLGDASPEAVQAAAHELDILAGAKQRIQQALDTELLHEPSEPRDATALSNCSLGQTVHDICDELKAKATQAGVTVELDMDEAAAADGSPTALRDALFNLVDNAMDASAGWVQIAVRRQDDVTVLTVSDDGPGLGPQDAARAFEPFFSTKVDGTGMGLAIADALVDELGGELRHERRHNRTTFVITVPRDATRVPTSA